LSAEQEVLGTDHQEIGGYIAKRWNLPDSLTEALGNHHPKDPKTIQNLPLLLKIVVLADNLSSSGEELPENLEGAAHRVDLIGRCTEAMGLELANIKKFYAVVSKEVLSNAEGMEINLGDAVEYLSRINTEIFQLYIDLANIFRERQELSGRLLTEERLEGTLESLHIALATLSHYINNASMNISGQCEVLQILYDKGDSMKVFEKIPEMTKSIKSSIKKISAVLEELSSISSLEKINYFKDSRAIDIEESLKERLEAQ
ncbi:MAG: HDOD domain-containing protein, partial [candidate division Zixibacteria bacterium]